MKKLGLLVMPLMAVSLLANCSKGGGGGGDDDGNPLTFTCLSDSSAVCVMLVGIHDTPINLEYKINNSEWQSISIDPPGYQIFELKKNDNIYFRGDNPNGLNNLSSDKDTGVTFSVDPNHRTDCGQLSVHGYLMSLLFKKDYESKTKIPPSKNAKKGCFDSLFDSNCAIVDASDLILPTELSNGCYSNMFLCCVALKKAPTLSATALTDYCYMNMFLQCESLADAPFLPATTLANNCYMNMFFNCSLNYLKVGFGTKDSKDWPSQTDCTLYWVTTYIPAEATTFEWRGSEKGPTNSDDSTVPASWTIKTYS